MFFNARSKEGGDVDWVKIRNEFENTPATLKELAEKYGIKEGTVRSRKCREKWKKKGATQRKKQQKKTVQQKKKDATKQKALPKKKVKSRKKVNTKDVVIENEKLTEKQRLFCIYFVKYWSATKAYHKAYGCSYNTANAEGYKLLVKPCVKTEIDRLKKHIVSGIYIEAMSVLQKYIDIAFSDITDFVTFGQKKVQVMGPFGPAYEGEGDNKKPVTKVVNFVDFKDSSSIDGTIITEVSQGKEGVKIKLADKMKALDKLDKYFDLFPDKFKRRIEEEKLRLEEAKIKGEDKEKEIHVHTGIPGVDDDE